MAGLVAAAEAASRGARVVVHEKGDRPGGSMLLSSGVVWRHRRLEDFRRECAGGTPELQRLVHERLDDDLVWLEGLGARVVGRSTGNHRTVGLRFDTRSLTETLTARGGELRLGEPLRELPDGVPVVLATGGFQAARDLVRRWITPEANRLFLRATPWSTGDGLRLGEAAGATTTDGMGELYGRVDARSAGPNPRGAVRRAGAALRPPRSRREPRGGAVRAAHVVGDRRRPVARASARRTRIYRIAAAQLAARVRERTVGEMVDAAERAGAPVRRADGEVAVEVVAGITTTLGGLAVDRFARAAPGVHAAGADVGGIATGGYASGLAAALVLGRIAAVSALEGR